jgi:hypothetical protein
MQNAIDSNGNVAVGLSSLTNCNNSNNNTSCGNGSLSQLTTGGNNSAFGFQAGGKWYKFSLYNW